MLRAQIHVDGKPVRNVQKRLRKLRRALEPSLSLRVPLSVPFPNALTNQAAATLPLSYDRWTPISAQYALPSNAEVDWLKGIARAPATWGLELDAARFVGVTSDYAVDLVDDGDVFQRLEPLYHVPKSSDTGKGKIKGWMLVTISEKITINPLSIWLEP